KEESPFCRHQSAEKKWKSGEGGEFIFPPSSPSPTKAPPPPPPTSVPPPNHLHFAAEALEGRFVVDAEDHNTRRHHNHQNNVSSDLALVLLDINHHRDAEQQVGAKKDIFFILSPGLSASKLWFFSVYFFPWF
ncbi:hypothetical protein U1Q18_050154, partial [Sarracenia purpurea var. burkii]